MEKHLNVLSQALNKANQAGAFNLQESAIVAQSLGAVIQALGADQPNPIEEARAAAKAQNAKDAPMGVVKEEPNGSDSEESTVKP